MSNFSTIDIQKQVNDLQVQAEEEEQRYNWKAEILLLKKIKKISLNNDLNVLIGETYFKLGEIYQIAADFEQTEQDVLNSFQISMKNYHRRIKKMPYWIQQNLTSNRQSNIIRIIKI